ncbi:MAG: hypothetical protein QG570_469, partial [Patescibacteria group bacterium]|nr:hypothetical protein [Patescibacteria group bacterium]
NMKVLLAASECSPLVKVGGVADVVGSLPIALTQYGIDVRIVIPFYKDLADKMLSRQANIKIDKIDEIQVKYGQKNLKVELYSTFLPGTEIIVYLIKNDDLITNGGIYFSPETMASPEAELERFALFSKVIGQYFGTPNKIFYPDVIHCNDWHTGMVPQVLQSISRFRDVPEQPRTIFTIHNLAYQGFSKLEVASKLELDIKNDRTLKWDAEDDNLDFVLQGVVGSDYITTVSKKYSEEIQTPEFGEGLHEILNAREARLEGILNGISYEVFNPMTDREIDFQYSTGDLKAGKQKNKEALLKSLGLEISNRPLLGIISRLAHQKGLDLVAESLDEIMEMGYSVVILGTGDPQLEMIFKEYNSKTQFNKRYKALITFSEKTARQIYAASDMFLVPSRYEPCGLTQMIAMKYGSVPVVRGTGGLYDTVEENVTGYVYTGFSKVDMLKALKRAFSDFTSNKAKWERIVINGVNRDYSWKESAKKYITLYKKATALKQSY